jgi:hypothetical protein
MCVCRRVLRAHRNSTDTKGEPETIHIKAFTKLSSCKAIKDQVNGHMLQLEGCCTSSGYELVKTENLQSRSNE